MRINRHNRIKPVPLFVAAAMLAIGFSSLGYLGQTSATPFTKAFLRLDRLQATTATSGRVCASPKTAATEASVLVTFPTTSGTDYVVNATAANWTVNTTNLDSGQTAWPTIGTASNVTGKAVTFPMGTPSALAVGTLYCFNFSGTSTLTTSSAAASETSQGNIATQTSTPTVVDQTTYSESIISNDQVVVSAVVPPSFSFVLSGNTDSFTTNLSTTSTVSTSGRTVSIITNAPSGWVVWVKDLNSKAGNGALQSVTAGNYKVAGSTVPGTASHTLASGAEDYGLATTLNTHSGAGVLSIDPAYDGTTAKAGTLDPTQFRPIAYSTGTANGDIINLNERATIAGSTPAASDYTDTMSVIGAGAF